MDLTERSQLTRWLAAQLLMTLLQSFVLALAVRWMILGYGRSVGVASSWAVALVAVGAVRLQRLALPGTGARKRRRLAQLERAADRTGGAVVSQVLGRPGLELAAPLPETLDRRFRRLARHADRLTYSIVETRHFASGVRPVLAELADDRLRRHYGIDLAAEPDRARAVMGDDLWQTLTVDRTEPPTAVELDRWLTALEALQSPDEPLAQHALATHGHGRPLPARTVEPLTPPPLTVPAAALPPSALPPSALPPSAQLPSTQASSTTPPPPAAQSTTQPVVPS